mmetsp:Transcript_16232/g.49396  ORF Transcript_16232/g.49396 Transcript_16232/m.49396 type:complete len:429 (+) Transcript_16232:86-1372(+)|eukprot:scaffold6965_cov32-Tisochrysis_lutea.AAC.2
MGGHLDEIRKIREARELAARRALRGLAYEVGSEGEESNDDADVPDASEITAADERLAAVAMPFGTPKPRFSAQRAQLQSPSKAAPLVAPSFKTVWSSEAATPGHPVDNPGDPADVFCVRFAPDDELVAAGCGDGVVRVYHGDGGRLAYSLIDDSLNLPTTCLRFRPSGSTSKTKNVLLAANSDGTVKHWHITSARCLHTITEENNQVYAIDYDVDGAQFATAGRDCHIRVYDEATKTVVTTLQSSLDRVSAGYQGETARSGHSNRIFGLRFGTEPHVILSGGWDNTVQLWDVRSSTSSISIYGPHVCGDALDLSGNYILSGSWRPEDQLQLWDVRTGGLVYTFPWPPSGREREPCQVYAAQFSRHDGGKTVVAGGSGANEVRAFSTEGRNAIAALTLPKGIYGLDISADGRRIATAAGDNAVRVLQMP